MRTAQIGDTGGVARGILDGKVQRLGDAFGAGDDMGGTGGRANLACGLPEQPQPAFEMRPSHRQVGMFGDG